MHYAKWNMRFHAQTINYTRFLKIGLLSFILAQLNFSQLAVYGEEWALHVEDGYTAASELAMRHNLVNLGEVLPDSKIYHFSLKNEHRGKRSTVDISNIQEQLKKAPETKWIEHQTVLRRSKRVPLTREKRQAGARTCVISTVGTDTKESRRCVFPFEYKEKVYLQCTSDHTTNGKEWCGTEVQSNGEVVSGKWGDCDKESIVCYTTKVVVEKESIGSVSPTTGRSQAGPAIANSNVRQRFPVNRQRPNSPVPSQNAQQRPFTRPQTSRLPPQQSSRLPPQLSARLPPQQSSRILPQQSSRIPLQQSSRLPPQQSSRLLPQQPSRIPPQQSSRLPPQFPRNGIPNQRPPPGFPPRQQAPQRTNAQGIPRQFLGRPPPRPNVQQQQRQQSFDPQVLPPLTEPVNPQRLSQEQILAILQQANIRRPPKEDNVIPENTPKLEDLETKWNDPLWPQMWFLNRGDDENGNGLDMNVEEAWKTGVSGKGVVVTILDDGVEWSHPDLEQNYDAAASRDLNDRDADPFPRYDILNSNKHGTRCAGQVSAAANNSKCGVGIAYNSKIGGVRVLDGAIVDSLEAEAMSFNRNHIDIYSASWGPDDDGRTVDGPGPLASRALEDGVLKGRNGLGSIFVWASGNGGKYFDNCNTDGYTTSIYTLSISSVSENGLIPWYSEPCSSSIATTYSSGATRTGERKVVTTDLRGKCTTKHTGTSASSPIASGIVALALEANKNMTWRDIQHIVVRSARPKGNLKAKDWRTNGVGLQFSHSYGFGLIDAGYLVKNAKKWKSVPDQTKCIYKQKLSEEKLQYLILPGREESISLHVENVGCIESIQHLEHFHIVINLASTAKRGDLSVSVISPMGTNSQLLGPRPFDEIRTGFSLFEKWPMMSVHFWGENPVGKWTLKIKNQGDTGRATLHDWHVIFYGTAVDPQPGSPIKPNYKGSQKTTSTSVGKGNGRKVELGKNSSKVEFTNLSKQDTLKNLAKICPSCFKSKTTDKNIPHKENKPIKLTKISTAVTTDADEKPNKSAGIANIAQVCPQCFKKKSKRPNDEIQHSKMDSTLTAPVNFENFEKFEFLSTPKIVNSSEQLEEKDSPKTSTINSKTNNEDDLSSRNITQTTNVNNETNPQNNGEENGNEDELSTTKIAKKTKDTPAMTQKNDSNKNVLVVTATKIEDEDIISETTEINYAIDNEDKEKLVEVASISSIEESEPRSLVNDGVSETSDE